MIVYKVAKTKYANDLSGKGAWLNGGRWNNKFIPCIYASETRALALLEYTINVTIDDIPRALSYITIKISDANIFELKEKDLPGNWKETPAPSSTKDFGSGFLKAAKFPVLKLPSAVIPNEFNYLLNPAHVLSSHFKIIEIRDFAYDLRIKHN